MVNQIGQRHGLFRKNTPCHGNAGMPCTVRVTADQRMPVGKLPALMQYPIGTGLRHPGKRIQIVRAQRDAVRHEPLSLRIVGAACRSAMQKLAGDVGVVNLAAVDILDLKDTAFAAPVAKRFPFIHAHFAERLVFPEGTFRHSLFLKSFSRLLIKLRLSGTA